MRTAARRGRKAGTLENKRNCWETKIVPSFRGRQAAQISHDEAQDVADEWAEAFGPHASLKAIREARHGFGLAMQRDWIRRQPFDGIHVPGAVRGEQRVMPAKARESLRAYLEPVALRGVRCRFRRVTCLALLLLAEIPAGRMSETAGLERRGVDLEAGVITWYRHKTDHAGPKHSVITPYARRVLSTAMDLAPGSEWVFPSSASNGGPVHDLTTSMARICAHVGLGRYTPHDLRRGIAQEALDGGASIEDVSALLGHESVRTTEAYLRWSPTRARRALRLTSLGANS